MNGERKIMEGRKKKKKETEIKQKEMKETKV